MGRGTGLSEGAGISGGLRDRSYGSYRTHGSYSAFLVRPIRPSSSVCHAPAGACGLQKLQQKHDCIGDVRGFGLMIGVEFVTDKVSLKAAPELRDRVEVACFERGLIILGAGTNTIRWSPPLILTKENVDVALEIFDEAISASV